MSIKWKTVLHINCIWKTIKISIEKQKYGMLLNDKDSVYKGKKIATKNVVLENIYLYIGLHEGLILEITIYNGSSKNYKLCSERICFIFNSFQY